MPLQKWATENIYDLIHVMLTVIVLYWALTLLLPGQVFDTGNSWKFFAEFFNQITWGVIFSIASTISILGGLFPIIRIFRYRLDLRGFSMQVLSCTHGTVASLILLSNPSDPNVIAYGILALLAGGLLWTRG